MFIPHTKLFACVLFLQHVEVPELRTPSCCQLLFICASNLMTLFSSQDSFACMCVPQGGPLGFHQGGGLTPLLSPPPLNLIPTPSSSLSSFEPFHLHFLGGLREEGEGVGSPGWKGGAPPLVPSHRFDPVWLFWCKPFFQPIKDVLNCLDFSTSRSSFLHTSCNHQPNLRRHNPAHIRNRAPGPTLTSVNIIMSCLCMINFQISLAENGFRPFTTGALDTNLRFAPSFSTALAPIPGLSPFVPGVPHFGPYKLASSSRLPFIALLKFHGHLLCRP